MALNCSFYEKEIMVANKASGKMEPKMVLHFKAEKQLSHREDIPFGVDAPATEAQKKEYSNEYKAFLKSKDPKEEIEVAHEVKSPRKRA